jgi:hypothetical protein
MFSKFFRIPWRLWDNVKNCCRGRHATDDNVLRRICIACWIPKATNTHLVCAVRIAFPLLQGLHEHASLSRCTYIACLVVNWHIFVSWTDIFLSRYELTHFCLVVNWHIFVSLRTDTFLSRELTCFCLVMNWHIFVSWTDTLHFCLAGA